MLNNLGRVIGYIRVSTEEQVKEGYSLSAQKKQINQFIINNNYEYDSIRFIDDGGRSGTTFNRPGINLTIKLIEDNEIDTFIFPKIDRLSRNILGFYKFKELCLANNVRLINVNVGVQEENATNCLREDMEVVLSAYESKNKSERVKVAQLEMAKQGLYPFGGTMPRGISRNSDNTIYFNDDIKIVKYCFKLLKESVYYSDVLKGLENKFSIYISKSQVDCMVNNTIYRGYIVLQGQTFNIIKPVISSEDIEYIKGRIWFRKRKYDKKRYHFKNKVYINGIKANHQTKNKKGKSYKYYYAPSLVYLPEWYIDKAFEIWKLERINDVDKKQVRKLRLALYYLNINEITKEEYNKISKSIVMNYSINDLNYGDVKSINYKYPEDVITFELKDK